MFVQLLEVMRNETNRINQLRGVWNTPSTYRDWNNLKITGQEQAPLAIEAYRSVETLYIRTILPERMQISVAS